MGTKHAIIIGAGVGGLVLGNALRRVNYRVTILERMSQLSEVGAGIQLAPNATRILRRMRLLDDILVHASSAGGTIVRRYSNDVEIGPRSHGKSLDARFDSPMLVIHRADLQKVLFQAALSSGVCIRFGATVVSTSFEAGVTLSTGEVIHGDILVGADGINSLLRKALVRTLQIPDKPVLSGDSAYRILIPRTRLLDCPEILDSMNKKLATRWVGPGGHIMAYPIREAELYNVVMVYSDSSLGSLGHNFWTRPGNISELHSFYDSWSPMVRSLAERVDPATLIQWPLITKNALPTWHKGKAVLIGDAAHPMLPYVAQGAAQAIEDAAVLAVCLRHSVDIQKALKVYESLRKGRAEYIQGSATTMRKVLHLPDGTDQLARDAAMSCTIRSEGWKHPDLWADPEFQNLVWGIDVVAEAEGIFANELEQFND